MTSSVIMKLKFSPPLHLPLHYKEGNKSLFKFKTPNNTEMGSLEEERLLQMVNDFIESDSSSPICCTSSKCLSHQPTYLTLLQEILRIGTEAENEVLECVKKHISRSKRETEKKKWLTKKLRSDGFTTASLCQCDYEYIEIIMVEDDDEEAMERVIVDIDFKSQFEVARPTSTYKELTDTLPSIFVGNEEKLNKVISVLCSAAKQSLKERGLHIPPWRTIAYMQSKWSHKNREPSDGDDVPKRSDFGGGGSELSSQLSKMGINCC